MDSLESELERARDLDVGELADAIESIGFECTRCGACCTGHSPGGVADGDGRDDDGPGGATDVSGTAATDDGGDGGDDGGDGGDDDAGDRDPHTATVFPDEIREIRDATGGEYDWRDVARPMPYGLDGGDGGDGETFEWALQVDDCGDCTFYEEDDDGVGACTIHPDRPLICRTYPFSVALGGTSQPMGEAVDREGLVRAHECEGLGRAITREEAEELATALKRRAVRELREAIAVSEEYDPVDPRPGEVVVHDSEGPKRPDGTPLDRRG